MGPKFGNSRIYIREVIQFDKDLTRKSNFSRGGICSSSILRDWF